MIVGAGGAEVSTTMEMGALAALREPENGATWVAVTVWRPSGSEPVSTHPQAPVESAAVWPMRSSVAPNWSRSLP